MTNYLPDIYRSLAVLFGGAIPATLVAEEGLPIVEKYGIVGLLFVMCGLFVKLWRDADKARHNEKDQRIKKMEERLQKQEAELELERTRNRTQ